MTTLARRIELGEFFTRDDRPGAARIGRPRARSSCSTTSELYELWERQQWLTQELDFTQDREDWAGFPAGGAPSADVRPVVVLHRRAAGDRGARAR